MGNGQMYSQPLLVLNVKRRRGACQGVHYASVFLIDRVPTRAPLYIDQVLKFLRFSFHCMDILLIQWLIRVRSIMSGTAGVGLGASGRFGVDDISVLNS